MSHEMLGNRAKQVRDRLFRALQPVGDLADTKGAVSQVSPQELRHFDMHSRFVKKGKANETTE
jgi:hypothetical protein